MLDRKPSFRAAQIRFLLMLIFVFSRLSKFIATCRIRHDTGPGEPGHDTRWSAMNLGADVAMEREATRRSGNSDGESGQLRLQAAVQF